MKKKTASSTGNAKKKPQTAKGPAKHDLALRVAAAVSSALHLAAPPTASRAGGRRMSMAAAAEERSFPPVLPWLLAYCAACAGRPVQPSEVLGEIPNVRQRDLNAAVNDTYHIPAGVARYPVNRPNMTLTVRGAAEDIRSDLESKGVIAP